MYYSSLCICYLTEQKGETAYIVNHAIENNITIVNLAKNSGYLFSTHTTCFREVNHLTKCHFRNFSLYNYT